MLKLEDVYNRLYDTYGPQGWWPLINSDRGGITADAAVQPFYHPGDYTYPRAEQQRFEICIGAILTQNTAWNNVNRALMSLYDGGGLDPCRMRELSDAELKTAIKPSGYYNMKMKKLRAFNKFYSALRLGEIPERRRLLDVWGIGPETADSILLYGYGQLHMVVDAYTRRFLGALGLIREEAAYEEVKYFCERELPPDVIVYQEFHALIVQHCKQYYSKKPYRDAVFSELKATV